MKRRTLLLAGLGGLGALVVGWGAWPVASRLRGKTPLPLEDGEVALNGWVKIGTDDSVTVMVPRCEMGQGIHTGLAMLLAEELGCDWQRVRVESSPIDVIYRNFLVVQGALPFGVDEQGNISPLAQRIGSKLTAVVGGMITGGSTSTPDLWQTLREAGATARESLVAIAARDWKVPAAECSVKAGVVTHPRAGSLGFGAVVGKAAAQKGDGIPEVGAVKLKDIGSFTIIGQPLPRLDALDKVTGRAQYAGDVREPGMLFAALAIAPRRDDTLGALDDAAALALPGVRGVARIPASPGYAPAVAVVADSHWQARRGAAALKCDWKPAAGPQASDAAVSAALWKAVRESTGGHVFREQGDVKKALPAGSGISAEYELPYLAHAAMEPMSCSAKLTDGRAVVHTGTQAPDVFRMKVAKLLGLEEDKVEMRFVSLGGSFGRRTELDVVLQAAHLAKAFPGRLVQLQWTREDDMRNDCYRPAAAARLRGAVEGGRIRAWHARSAVQSATEQLTRRLLDMPPTGPDKGSVEGAHDIAYDIPDLRVENENITLPVVVGVWRGVGFTYQSFCTESFVDELALAAGADPVAFRLAHLEGAPRQAAVLRLAAEKAGWGTPPAPAPDGAPVARGVALVRSFGTPVAQVVEVSVGPDGAPRVHRVVCAVDCGVAINPNLIRQQVEGGIVFGLTAALHGKVSFNEGQVSEGNFDAYRMLRLTDSPAIEVHIVPSRETPTGIGEVGVPPIAPAVANALAALTGKRVRRLPLVTA